MKKTFILTLIVMIYCEFIYSQVSINNDGSSPHASAMLEVKSNNLGFLPPRVALTAIDQINPIEVPATGLLIYNTTISGTPPNNVIPGYYFWNGTKWVACDPPQGSNPGDLLYWDGMQWLVLPVGSDGQVLIKENGTLTWGYIQLPLLVTASITGITTNSAISGGNITSIHGTPVTARGVCWSTSENPTIEDDHTTDGSGLGSFTSSLTGLNQYTTYYVRAYASTSLGTSYGNQLSFTTDAIPLQILIVGGGGGAGGGNTAGGAYYKGGGGGAGEVLNISNFAISSGSYSIIVGTGTIGNNYTTVPGNPSSFDNIFIANGGYSGRTSLGGNSGSNNAGILGYGSSQNCDHAWGGGGGGAAAAASGSRGGDGYLSNISGSEVYYAGGGKGGWKDADPGNSLGYNGPGAGGAASLNCSAGGGAGYNGIIIIRYTNATPIASGGTISYSGGDIIHTFTTFGTFTVY